MVKYVTVHGKCSAISDGDWRVFSILYETFSNIFVLIRSVKKVRSEISDNKTRWSDKIL